MAQYLPRAAPDSSYTAVPGWPGLHGQLDPLLWLPYATGAFVSTGAMRPAIAFLGRGAPDAASEGMLHRDAARAMAAAERLLAPEAADAGESGGGVKADGGAEGVAGGGTDGAQAMDMDDAAMQPAAEDQVSFWRTLDS